MMAWLSVRGVTLTTPGDAAQTVHDGVAVRARSSTSPWTYMWPLKPSIRPSSSLRKPAMMLITMIRAMTASMMPTKEMMAIRATPPSLRLARR